MLRVCDGGGSKSMQITHMDVNGVKYIIKPQVLVFRNLIMKNAAVNGCKHGGFTIYCCIWFDLTGKENNERDDLVKTNYYIAIYSRFS